jgi:hypothetical protein
LCVVHMRRGWDGLKARWWLPSVSLKDAPSSLLRGTCPGDVGLASTLPVRGRNGRWDTPCVCCAGLPRRTQYARRAGHLPGGILVNGRR